MSGCRGRSMLALYWSRTRQPRGLRCVTAMIAGEHCCPRRLTLLSSNICACLPPLYRAVLHRQLAIPLCRLNVRPDTLLPSKSFPGLCSQTAQRRTCIACPSGSAHYGPRVKNQRILLAPSRTHPLAALVSPLGRLRARISTCSTWRSSPTSSACACATNPRPAVRCQDALYSTCSYPMQRAICNY